MRYEFIVRCACPELGVTRARHLYIRARRTSFVMVFFTTAGVEGGKLIGERRAGFTLRDLDGGMYLPHVRSA